MFVKHAGLPEIDRRKHAVSSHLKPAQIFDVNVMTTEETIVNHMFDTANTVPENFLDRERYKTLVIVNDFAKIPRFVIDTPTFQFDSHGETAGWQLKVRQRWYNKQPGKLTAKLVHGTYRDGEGLRIRISKDAAFKRIETVDDVVELFMYNFAIVHTSKLAMVDMRPKNIVTQVKDLSAYTDEELLAELHNRTMTRLNGYRGPRTELPVFDLSNVIDLDSIRPTVFDDTELNEILAA